MLSARLNELAVVFVSIVLQSLPFVLIGVFASALVQQYLAERHVDRWLPRNPVLATVTASLLGLVAPVCDCGAIPLGRRLASKGVPTPAALAFMLAAPIVNPVVIFATLVAFQGAWGVVATRLAMALIVAIGVALAVGAVFPAARLARPTPLPVRGGSLEGAAPSERSARTWGHATGDPARTAAAGRLRRDLTAVVGHASRELFDVLFFVVLGGLFTASAQTMLPRGDLAAVGGHPLWSVVVLMPVATLLSICSEADAFVGRAFANTFTFGAVLAFLTIGQIVDLRNGFLMTRVLGGRLASFVFGLSYALVLLLAVAVNVVVRRV
jgi:uncharacterized membrane protein YraQ (UPF0718 family)